MRCRRRRGVAEGFARLWAPWRMGYIRAAHAAAGSAGGSRGGRRPAAGGATAAARAGCLFCRVSRAAEAADRDNLVLARSPRALLMLNRFPYNAGHLMVAVRRHAARFQDLTPDEAAELVALTALAERALGAEYRPDGMNYGLNVGRVAGAGFPGHLHMHLVPRWDGDTNFMPAVAGTRVLPESLEQTWQRLSDALKAARPARRTVRRRRGATR